MNNPKLDETAEQKRADKPVHSPAPPIAPADQSSSQTKRGKESSFYIVGVGASAGGLEALEEFFSGVAADTGMAYVVVQHLSPDFKSLMVELLSRHTKMRIRRVKHGMSVEPNTLYLIPPKQEMAIQSGRLLLTERVADRNLSLPIDHFFRSLARDAGPLGIAIVLSGTGSDGSRGLVDVHLAGGLVIAQSTETAKFDGMPRTAIGTGMVDVVATPTEMPHILKRYAQHPFASEIQPSQIDPHSIERVFELLQQRHGIDFAEYKPATIGRRIERRMKLYEDSTLDQYIGRLESDPTEIDQLFKDLLIGVTSFFRDADAFELLSSKIFPQLLEAHDEQEDFRGWIAGCATGEEAYSIAITIHEVARRLGKAIRVKLFATDAHQQSLETAHPGIYPKSIVDEIPEDLIKRYFVETNEGYQIIGTIRDSIVFAPHNLVTDTPFTNLNFVSCRNVLIYFRALAQRKVLSLLHFALRKGGCLFLGASESPGELSEEFGILDERWKIFRKLREARLLPENQAKFRSSVGLSRNSTGTGPSRAPVTTESRMASLYDRMLERFMPEAVLVDSRKTVMHVFGGAGRFMTHSDGRPSTNILELVGGDLQLAIAGGLQRIRKSGTPIHYPHIDVPVGQSCVAVGLEIWPVSPKKSGDNYYLLLFHDLDAASAEVSSSSESSNTSTRSVGSSAKENKPQTVNLEQATLDRMSDLEAELRYTKEDLQATIEELETSNEELQATNEEMVASNEELQSTNEELHSVNEELYTVNREYQKKISELTTLTNDMDNLLVSTDVHTLFLDSEMVIRRFTPKMADVFRLLPQDVGRAVNAFTHSILCDDLVAKIEQVLNSGQGLEERVEDKRGQQFLMRVLPYRVHQATTGVVLTLVDIDSLIAAQDSVARERERFERAIAANRDGIWDWPDLSSDPMWWSPHCWELLGYGEDELEPRHSTWLGLIHPEDRARVQQTSIPAQQECYVELHRDFEYRMLHKSGEYRWFRHRAIVDRDPAGRPIRMTGSVGDIHDRKSAELQKIEATEAIERRDRFLAMLSHELRNPMSAIMNSIEYLDTDGGERHIDSPTSASKQDAFEIIKKQTKHMARLLDDLLDVSRFGQQKIGFRWENIDLVELHHDVVKAAKHLIDKKHQVLKVDVPEHPIRINGDPARLKQAQINLLANASRYSGSGALIRYSLRQVGDFIRITFQDEGVGIDPEMRDRIFDWFVQSDSSLARSSGGMGVGLSLARQIIESHHGTLSVKSEGVGRGSVFEICLSLTEQPKLDSPPQANETGLSVSSEPPSGMRILIVEDNTDAGRMLGLTLQMRGNEVCVAAEGFEALELYQSFRPEIAIIDIGLPTMNGYELVTRMRKIESVDAMLVALTGYGRESDRQRALDAGFDVHFVKPLDPVRFFETINRHRQEKKKDGTT